MSNLSKALRVEFPDDVEQIRKIHTGLNRFSDIEVEMLWQRFSRSRCAGWLGVDTTTSDDFYSWLED